jgi:hypothetical protein
MRATRVCRAAWGAAVLLAACVSNPAPNGWLPPAGVATRDAYGGWIVADTAKDDRRGRDAGGSPARVPVAGELIAVDPDTVFVMSGEWLVGLPKGQVRRATLFAYDPQWGQLAAWGVVGTLSTISNGLGLILTAPLWIITSTSAASSRSRAPRVELADRGDRWEKLRLYARFPQGMPPGLDRRSVRPAPGQARARAGGQ